METAATTSLTILLPAGRLDLEVMAAVHGIAVEYGVGIYLSTLQNLRLIDVPLEKVGEIKERLQVLGVDFKAAGKFPIPRVCIGKDHCRLGLIDTEKTCAQIVEHFGERQHTKAKIKIALAACTMCCSGVKTTDIGIMATRVGYEVYVGGKGGPYPKVGRRIGRRLQFSEVLQVITELVEFHDRKTEKKQRMYKLLADPDFPFPDI